MRLLRCSVALSALAPALPAARAADPAAQTYFVIRVIDGETGRGVPLIELETVNQIAHVTDSAGVIAFHEPGLMDREVFFHVRGHGYEYPKDGFGYRGLKLTPRAGAAATVKVARRNLAERLYRVTGAGIYRDSVLAGGPVPLRAPSLNGEVLGQDTVIVTPYRGKLHWFWGDTNRASYPLGNFAVAGATSEPPGRGGLAAGVGVDLTYFVNAAGFAKAMCPDFGPGLHWIEGVITVPDERGVERLVARVSSQKGLVPPYAWHFAVFNDEKQVFESRVRWEAPDVHDSAHPFRAHVGGTRYYYLYPNYRVPADLASLADPQRYEAFTCVSGQGRFSARTPAIDRDARGAPRYAWKQGADRLHAERVRRLQSEGGLQPGEAWLPLRDVATDTALPAGRGSVFWNEYRRRWVMLVSAAPGEIWFAEADTPTGPWAYARRVVAHDHYNFYNPTQHPFFDEDGGRTIYFEGTYTAAFSGAKAMTPRYDYNQIMYRLRLEDARLDLPAAVHRVGTAAGPRLMQRDEIEAAGAWAQIEAVEFFALPPARTAPGLIPIYEDAAGRLRVEAPAGTAPRFRALPATTRAEQGIAGRWLWRVKDRDGGELSFDVDLAERDGAVIATGRDHPLAGRGALAGGRVTLAVALDERTYRLTAEFRPGTLRGDWERDDRQAGGTWAAQWQDSTPEEFRSAAVVPLYEYEHPADGRVAYSTDPHAPFQGLVRREQALCRVWRSPTTAVLFDRIPLTADR